MQTWEYCRLFVEHSNGNRGNISVQVLYEDVSETHTRTDSDYNQPPDVIYSKMAALGKDGWELVLREPDGSYVFKRPRQ